MVKGSRHSGETRQRMGESHRGHPSPRLGKALGKEAVRKLCQMRNGTMKLRYEDAVTIRHRLLSGDSGLLLARDYGVDPAIITRIKKGIIWKPENYEVESSTTWVKTR